MASKPESLPTIDIQALYHDDAKSRALVDEAMGRALEKFGGFLAIGLPASPGFSRAGMESLFALFDLPQPVLYKMGKREMCPSSKRCMRGYVDRRSGGFAYNEIFDIGPERPVSGPDIDGIELVTETNVWPSTEPTSNWREKMVARFIQMEKLGVTLIRSLARYLKVNETAAAARYRDSSSSMRLLKYPGHARDPANKNRVTGNRVDNEKKPVVIGKRHTDNGGLTFQWQDQPGLQIRTPDGEWLDVPEKSEGLSVHLGEALETQSCGRLAATPHRVLGWNSVRHSIVFFLEPNLFGSIEAFSTSSHDSQPAAEQTYAASMINTLRVTGRA